MSNTHVQFMLRALSLAKKGLATVSPNPMVGAVVVNEKGEIVGEGFHVKKGEPHAEVHAIHDAIKKATDLSTSTLYCTLEPCCHTNKLTPPCADLIIEKKLKKVVIGCLDPNPQVAGNGVQKIRAAGIEVETEVLKEECEKLNEVFFTNMTKKRPFIHLKVAATLDGRIATSSGNSKWITSDQARKEVHELRNSYDAVMVGKNTLRFDNPELTSRIEEKVIKAPIKIIVGNLEDKDLSLKAFSDKSKVINICTQAASITGIKQIHHTGSWIQTFNKLYEESICSILIEGGAQLLSSIIEENIFDRYTCYLAPKLIGNGPSLFMSEKEQNMEKAKLLNGSWRLLNTNEVVFEGVL